MRAADALAELQRMGLVIEIHGDQLLVTPREQITDRARVLIVQNRDGLLDLLRQVELRGCDIIAQRVADLADAYHERMAMCLEGCDISEAEAETTAALEVGRAFVRNFVHDQQRERE
jgi:hypothetical protein